MKVLAEVSNEDRVVLPGYGNPVGHWLEAPKGSFSYEVSGVINASVIN